MYILYGSVHTKFQGGQCPSELREVGILFPGEGRVTGGPNALSGVPIYDFVFEFHHLSVFTFYKFIKFMHFFMCMYVPIKTVRLKSQEFPFR